MTMNSMDVIFYIASAIVFLAFVDNTTACCRTSELQNEVNDLKKRLETTQTELDRQNQRINDLQKNGTMSSPLSTHVLDNSRGLPGDGIAVTLYKLQGDDFVVIKKDVTNSDGRVPGLLTDEQFTAATYKLKFETKEYFDRLGMQTFYPYVETTFTVMDPKSHHHVPILLSPFAYSTYRGS
ncbi:unnamed protein product [Owenia fusiformis]|uniref:hydroxyisourate hydrolase n=1 Tax=Owenia fusiformis TaxID=6347 RepID=A0A8J1TUK4_OWEFU|nr:unnamed protein product [Owenia fusiformis]